LTKLSADAALLFGGLMRSAKAIEGVLRHALVLARTGHKVRTVAESIARQAEALAFSAAQVIAQPRFAISIAI